MPLIERGEHQYAAPDGSKSGLIPIEYATQIIQSAVDESAALRSFRRIPMSTKVEHLPVLDALPIAKWVNGEPDATAVGGKKSVTEMAWKGVVLHAEEIAAIVPVHESVLEDMSIDLWAQVRPQLAAAIGVALDLAVFLGTDKPASWPAAIIPAATTATNTVASTAAPATDYNALFGLVEADGYEVTGVFAKTSEKSRLRGANASGVPIYVNEFRGDGRVDAVYGETLYFDRSGFLGANDAVAGDTSMAIIGTRTDLTWKLLTEATIDISAAQDGSAMLNLAQQDSVALRVRARFAFAVANPPNRLNTNAATRYPFAVLT